MATKKEILNNIKLKALKDKIKTFKRMKTLFEKRLESWRKAEMCCPSWDTRYIEGGRDECKVFIKYLEIRIKKLEKTTREGLWK